MSCSSEIADQSVPFKIAAINSIELAAADARFSNNFLNLAPFSLCCLIFDIGKRCADSFINNKYMLHIKLEFRIYNIQTDLPPLLTHRWPISSTVLAYEGRGKGQQGVYLDS